jgi:dTDP-4-dehydrorhamnose reductase
VILVVGSQGNLSLATRNLFVQEEIHIVGSEIAKNWCDAQGPNQIDDYVESLQTRPKLIINAAGIVNPLADVSKLVEVNYYLPRNLHIYCKNNNIKLVTFGTIMETNLNLSNSNAYMRSKRMFFDYLRMSNGIDQTLHLQIHTWYGGHRFHDHMFLSQMFKAIKAKTRFQMSSGLQFREYHHISDDLIALKFLLEQEHAGIFQMNHGEAMSLKDLAKSVFEAFDSLGLLEMNKLESPKNEFLTNDFHRNSILDSVYFRDTQRGIVDHFRKLLQGAQ